MASRFATGFAVKDERDAEARSDVDRRPTTKLLANARYVVLLAAAIGVAATLILHVVPGLEPAYQNRALHVAKETASALVLLLVAALLFGRFRRSARLLDLLALAGVVVLAGKNLVFSVLTAILIETSGGLTTWRMTGAGMLGAALLAAAALAPQRVVTDRRKGIALVTVAAIAGLCALMAIASTYDLPAAFTDPPETRAELHYLSQHPALLVADIGATALFLIAGVAFGRRAELERDEFQLWLGIGAAIAGVAYLNYSLFPSAYTDFLYSGDIFRIFAVAAWGIGTIRQISAYQAGYAEAAVHDERRRVARELHDGVAQELAFISSQMHWLAKRDDDKESTGQIMEAVQRALDESRGAISALSSPVTESLSVTLAHTAEEVAGRLDVDLELDLDDDVSVPAAWEVALPRILREAVANAVRHGHARTVTVSLSNGDGVGLRVIDDGEGFDVSLPRSDASFGLTSMRERAETLGGEFKLASEPGRGTSIEIRLP